MREILFWDSNMTRDQKEQYILELYQQGKTIREIAKLTHTSFRDIGIVVDNHKTKTEEENRQPSDDVIEPRSKESKAFKLFSEDKSPVEVAIALDLPADRVRAIYHEFWELQGMHELCEIYKEAKYDLRKLLRLHETLKNLRMEDQQIIDVLKLAKHHQLEKLQWKVGYLVSEIWKHDMEIKNKKSILATLNEIISDLKDERDGRIEERTREFYIKEGFRLVTNEWNEPENKRTITYAEPGIIKKDNLKHSYKSDYNIEVFYASGDWKGIP